MNWWVFGWALVGIGLTALVTVFVLHLTIGKNNKVKIFGWKNTDNKNDYKKALWYLFYFLAIAIIAAGIIVNYGSIPL